MDCNRVRLSWAEKILRMALMFSFIFFCGILQTAFALNVPFFSQRDPSWSSNQLGTCTVETIYSHGCATTSKAMIFSYYQESYTDPGQLNGCLRDNGGYADGCLAPWDERNDICAPPEVTFAGHITSDFDNTIDSELSNGYPVMAKVHSTSVDMHFVVITGKSDGTYYISDPWDLEFVNRTLETGFFGSYLIDALWLYHGSTEPQISNHWVYVDNFGPNEAGFPTGPRLHIGAYITDPLGVPDNIDTVTAYGLSPGQSDYPLIYRFTSAWGGNYSGNLPPYNGETGSWEIVAVNMQGETATTFTHNLDKPRIIPLASNIQFSDQSTTPTITWDPVLFDHDLDPATPPTEVHRYEVVILRSGADQIYASGSFANTSFTVPGGVIPLGEPIFVRIRATMYDQENGAWHTENKSETFVPFTATSGPSLCTISGVPLIHQTDPPWDADIYDTSSETIAQWGSALTSAVMIINYHGASVGFQTDPRLLNNWLIAEPDGYAGVIPNHFAVARYARDNGVSLYYYGLTGRDDTTLREFICARNPVMLQVPGHSIVATGEANIGGTDTWTINDPYYPRFDLRSYNNDYEGIRKYFGIKASPALLIGTYPTVQFLVIDPEGRRTGFDPATGETLNEIPDATYSPQYLIDPEDPNVRTPIQYVFEAIEPLDGDYNVQLSTAEPTEYTAYFFGYDEEYTPSTSILTADIGADSTQTYLVDYSTSIGEPVKVARFVNLDIKPQSCPNPLNVKSKGVLPIAILGTQDFDVTDIDPATVQLEGVAPVRWALEDVSTPVSDPQDDCDCTEEGGDGFADLTLKYKNQEIVVNLGEVNDGDELVLTITGALTDGTAIEGYDCIVILKKGKKH